MLYGCVFERQRPLILCVSSNIICRLRVLSVDQHGSLHGLKLNALHSDPSSLSRYRLCLSGPDRILTLVMLSAQNCCSILVSIALLVAYSL